MRGLSDHTSAAGVTVFPDGDRLANEVDIANISIVQA